MAAQPAEPQDDSPLSDEEKDRLAALHALAILDTPREERFDRITRLAQRLLQVPIAMISLVDRDRQWYKSCVGVTDTQQPRSVSFCSRAVAAGRQLVVPDATLDPRFSGNPLVTGPPGIRFYAGYPLAGPSGHLLGTLCVLDLQPRAVGADDLAALADLAAWAELEIGVVHMSRASRETDRLKDEFVAVVSHELRTPLSAVNAALELLDGHVGSPRDEKLVSLAQDNTGRLRRLVDDILDVQRLAVGSLPLRRAVTDLTAAAATAVAGLEPEAVRQRIALSVAGDPVPVMGDRDRLVQVFGNLVGNAVKFSGAGTRVHVVVGRRPGPQPEAVAEVHDEGPGIPPDELGRVFDKFVRLERTAGGDPGGAGLGLAISRGLVEAHGGTLSARPGERGGTVFSVRLPAFAPEPPPSGTA
ncbi:ATP-binding protein [Kitasatospora sp. NBC_01539]|uniref:GAF domain-containing sensor histidine kinase n=1 Tax=Kitasatospora sp. NBC_01539 TaxID=2903577 RepID=UPI0038601E03